MLHGDLASLLPFHALTRPGGASAANSLCLTPGGILGPLTSLRLLYHFGEPLALLSDALLLLSTLLVSLSSEAIGVTLGGDCAATTPDQDRMVRCYLSLAVVESPARAAEAIMVTMAVLALTMGILLHRWRTGVAANPWSIVGVAALLPSRTAREAATTLELIRTLPFASSGNGLMCALRYRSGGGGGGGGGRDDEEKDYGLVVWLDGQEHQGADDTSSSIATPRSISSGLSPSSSSSPSQQEQTTGHQSPLIMHPGTRAAFAAVLCGFTVIIVFYETGPVVSEGFERFMNSQNFGNSFLFTSIGIMMGFFWDSFHSCKDNISLFPRR